MYNIDRKKWRKRISLCQNNSCFLSKFIFDFCCSILSDWMHFGLSPRSPVSLSLNVRICTQRHLNHHQHLKGKIKKHKIEDFCHKWSESDPPSYGSFSSAIFRPYSFLLQFNPIYHILTFVFTLCKFEGDIRSEKRKRRTGEEKEGNIWRTKIGYLIHKGNRPPPPSPRGTFDAF